MCCLAYLWLFVVTLLVHSIILIINKSFNLRDCMTTILVAHLANERNQHLMAGAQGRNDSRHHLEWTIRPLDNRDEWRLASLLTELPGPVARHGRAECATGLGVTRAHVPNLPILTASIMSQSDPSLWVWG